MVDALVLGTSTARCGGSSPPVRTRSTWLFPLGAMVDLFYRADSDPDKKTGIGYGL